MAEVPRLTTPITNRNIMTPSKESRNANEIPFDFQDLSKVKQTTQSSDLQGQNNVLRQDGSTTGFYEILHDPDVSAAFLKSIFLLREIVDILPMNNSTQTEEMANLMDSLVLKPEEITAELMKQEDISTLFKGGLFDILRQLTAEHSDGPAVFVQGEKIGAFESAVAGLLKALNNEVTKDSVLRSVENNLNFLSEKFAPSQKLSEQLSDAAQALKQFALDTDGLKNLDGAQSRFLQLKSDIFSLFSELEKSILFNDESAKTMSMATYNLSRISTADGGVSEAFAKLLGLLDNDAEKENLTNALLKFLDEQGRVSESKTMNALTEILRKQSENPDLKMINPEGMNKIIQSLLSSPCNFTPLLHYVIPVEYEDVQASAEMWINPDGQEDLDEPTQKKCTHLLIVFDIEQIGKFETELFVQEKSMDLSIKCPEEYTEFYKSKLGELRKDLSFSDYRIKKAEVEAMTEPRSLIEVFKSLPLRRTGVNVTI